MKSNRAILVTAGLLVLCRCLQVMMNSSEALLMVLTKTHLKCWIKIQLWLAHRVFIHHSSISLGSMESTV